MSLAFQGLSEILLVSVTYYITAQIGLLLAIPPGNVTPVWLPSGIIFAWTLIRGYHIWPGIFVGAFAANVFPFFTEPPTHRIIPAIIAGSGNGFGDILSTFGAIWMIEKYSGCRNPFDKTNGLVWFLCIGVVIGSIFNSFIGTTALAFSGSLPWEKYFYTMFTWFTGNGMGVLLLTPFLIVTLMPSAGKLSLNRQLETGINFAFLILVGFLGLLGMNTILLQNLSMFFLIPILIWASIRLERWYTFLGIMVMSFIAISGAVKGYGPFAVEDMNITLIQVQLFVGVMGIVIFYLNAGRFELNCAIQKLKSYGDGLEKLVDERTAELKSTNLKLQEEVTERRRSEKVLKESEERFKSVLENTSDSIILTDETGKIIYWNKGSQSIFGYIEDEILGESSDRLMPEDVKTIIDERLKSKNYDPDLFEFGAVHKSYAKRKDGSLFPIDITLSSWDRDGTSCFCSIIRDITEREKAEAKLNLERNQLLSIFDGMDEVIYISDPETHELLYINDPFRKQWGDGIGKKCHKILQNLDSPCPFCTNHIIFKENPGSSYIWEWQNKVNNHWYRCIDKAIQWPPDKLVRLEVAVDITDLKKAEEQLNQAQRMESVGTLAGGIAHEFNNILGGILGYTEIAKEDAPDISPVQESLEEISKLGIRARNVVRQILAFSRKDRHQKSPIQLSSVLEEELMMLRSTIPTTVEIRQLIDKTCGTILADSTQIQQVLMNLCVNANDAMQEKGGVLEVSLSPVFLDMEDVKQYPDLSPGEYVKLSVRDTGPGIDPNIIDKIFDPFFTTKGVGKGTGLGLSVVHGIIKDHGGAIMVSSKSGEGTTFTVIFPVTYAEVKAKGKEENLPTGTENILIVDDEEFIVFPQKKTLERLGYTVTAMTNSLETLNLFKKDPQRYDLIITDLTMPHLTGDRLASEVTAIRPDMPVILATGYADAFDDEKVKESGIKAFIPKPCQKEDLAKIIRIILDEK